jgi:LysM domain
VRKWTKSACVVVALGILFLLTVIGFGESAHPAQAKTSIASSSSSRTSSSSTQAVPASPASLMTVTAASLAATPPVTWVVRPGDTLSGIAAALGVRGGWQALYAANRRQIGPDPGLIRPGVILAVPGGQRPLSYAVAPGDTLSAVAAALGVRGGWRALYAANRRLIGPDPGLIRPGMILAVPGEAASGKAPAVPGTRPGGHQAPTSPPARGSQPHRPTAGATPGTGATPTVPGSASPAGLVPVRGTGPDGAMPSWLKATLLAVGVLTVASFIAQPAVAAWHRRRRSIRARAAGQRDRGQRTAEKAARIVQADHERLIITYSISDDTVYVLTPPGEDPRAVLRAARLVLPEDTYEELADHLGVPSGWQRE